MKFVVYRVVFYKMILQNEDALFAQRILNHTHVKTDLL